MILYKNTAIGMRGFKSPVFSVLLLVGVLCQAQASGPEALPSGFVYASEVVPGVIEDIRYFGHHNFVGTPIRGYDSGRCILSLPAAQALKAVAQKAQEFHLTLKLFDCYRPQTAVNHFVEWAGDLNDQQGKANYYPHVDKSRLFAEGYIAEKSGHSRGSTVDLTLVDADTGHELPMGTRFDAFGLDSWPDAPSVPAQARANRLLLQTLMVQAGFKLYPQEWWHFTLANEPFPETYFDFPVR